jgi:hypothetical protein
MVAASAVIVKARAVNVAIGIVSNANMHGESRGANVCAHLLNDFVVWIVGLPPPRRVMPGTGIAPLWGSSHPKEGLSIMLKRQFSLLIIVLMLATLVVPATAQQQINPKPGVSVPITGNARQGGNLTGTFTILQFVNMGTATNPQLGAVGTLAARTARGDTVVSQIVMPVVATTRAAAATSTGGPTIQQVECEILDLVLGPLDLNLAGLEIHLDTVHLLITADPTGGLLGSLLSGLLCGGGLGGLLGDLIGNLEDILAILNNLLAILNGLGI